MKEIGGYIELEHYHGKMLHDNGIKLDSGRNCLAYLIKAKRITKIALPYFMCETASMVCVQYGVKIQYYHVGLDFRIDHNLSIDEDAWLYVVNYYGQLTMSEVLGLKQKYPNLILDNAQAYFEEPIAGIDTLYTCRKFFGVPDGGILFTDTILTEEIEQSVSYEHMNHILGRYEKDGTTFYKDSVANNDRFIGSPLRRMSKLTENLLRSVDYAHVKAVRTANYSYLHRRLSGANELKLQLADGAFAYPLLVKNGDKLRKQLIANKIYVPTLWPNVLAENDAESVAYRLTKDILPLPCDQRYGKEEMMQICDLVDLYLIEK